jgi:plasmid stability protein
VASVITIRNLDEETQSLLKHRAVDHGVSFEAEIRATLRAAAQAPAPQPARSPALFAAAAAFRQAVAAGGVGPWSADEAGRAADQQRDVPL